MNYINKILHWIEDNRYSDRGFEELCGFGSGTISTWRDQLAEGRLPQAGFGRIQSIVQKTGMSADYLFDDSKGWPPPVEEAVKIRPVERQLLDLCNLVSRQEGDGPGMETAFARLILSHPYYRAAPGEPIRPSRGTMADVEGPEPEPPRRGKGRGNHRTAGAGSRA